MKDPKRPRHIIVAGTAAGAATSPSTSGGIVAVANHQNPKQGTATTTRSQQKQKQEQRRRSRPKRQGTTLLMKGKAKKKSPIWFFAGTIEFAVTADGGSGVCVAFRSVGSHR